MMEVNGQGGWIAKLQLQTSVYCLYTTVALVEVNMVKYMYTVGVHDVTERSYPEAGCDNGTG